MTQSNTSYLQGLEVPLWHKMNVRWHFFAVCCFLVYLLQENFRRLLTTDLQLEKSPLSMAYLTAPTIFPM